MWFTKVITLAYVAAKLFEKRHCRCIFNAFRDRDGTEAMGEIDC